MPLNFRQLVDQHPELLKDRFQLAFSQDASPKAVTDRLGESGVIMLRGALPARTLSECQATFSRFVSTLGKNAESRSAGSGDELAADEDPSPEWDNGEEASGSWHKPWAVKHGGHSPTATVLSALIRSWAWPVIEQICHSEDIVVMFGLCLARHRIDEDLQVGVHQDARVVNPEIPLSLWIPLSEVAPKRHSGLGFVVPNPNELLPLDDAGSSYVLDNLDRVWVPHYRAGDLTIHSKFSPHFTTGYGTHSHRYSLEIRLWAYEDSLTQYYDPSMRVTRRNGVPVVVGTKCTIGVGAHGFVANTAQMAMGAATVPSAKQPSGSGFMSALRSMVR
jgi:hypothetical protein